MNFPHARLWRGLAIGLAILCGPFVGAETLNVYFGNLHSHTSYSDGSGKPAEAYSFARDVAKLDFLAVTEHNHKDAPSLLPADPSLYNGSRSDSVISAAKRSSRDGKFIALYGQEFSSIGSGNHANVLEVGELIKAADVPNGEWDKLFDEWLPAHPDSQGKPAIVLLNHPAQSSSPNDKEYGIDDYNSVEEWLSAIGRQTSLMNIVNGPSHDADKPPGRPSENEFRRYLNLGLHVAPTADQDNHLKNWGGAANTRTGVIAPHLTRGHLLEAMRNRQVYASEDKNLRLIGRVNGEIMGARFQGAKVPEIGSALEIVLLIQDDDEPQAHYKIEVFGDEIGGTNETKFFGRTAVLGNGVHAVSGVNYLGGTRYYYLKVTQTDEDEHVKDRAWLAPVWFEPEADSPELRSSSGSPSQVMTLEVDRVGEAATIFNSGTEAVDLSGWTLVSIKGNQRFTLPADTTLGPGRSLVVTSGPLASEIPPGRLKWTGAPRWADDGDPGELLDSQGVLRAKTDEEDE